MARAVAPETTPRADAFVTIGRIVRTHGLDGEVAFKPDASFAASPPVGLEVWFVPPPSGVRTARVATTREGPKGPLVRFDGIDDIASASPLRGTTVLAERSSLPPELIVERAQDPVGLAVRDEEHGALGEVVDLIVTGANDVWVVHGDLGEVLIPVIDDVVLTVDEDSRTAHVRLLPGLLDEDAGA